VREPSTRLAAAEAHVVTAPAIRIPTDRVGDILERELSFDGFAEHIHD
jgi:hypothetical protein